MSQADIQAQAEKSQRPSVPDDLPISLLLELNVHDPEVIAELWAYPEGEARDDFALQALRLGVLVLRQARGQLDAQLIRRETEHLLGSMRQRLDEHTRTVHQRLTDSLTHYFDPKSGQLQERISRLIDKDGELEGLLRRQVGNEDSELCKTLAAHVGEHSPLMKMLGPDESEGVVAAIRETLEVQLRTQRDHVLKEFSLDNKGGALARFISELTENQEQITKGLQGKIDEVVKEFSLDQEDSALSRLVRNVDRAQRTITSEFSLDEENSALARLKRELVSLLNTHNEANQKFQQEVRVSLEKMAARREEAGRSTRHGLEFEDAVFAQVQDESQKVGDIAQHTGNTTGQIKHCKVGDCVIELGPESAAPGARVVVEAKEDASYDLAQARGEIETARKNRDAQVGLFVFSKKTAPEGLEPLLRLGTDVFVVWDAEDAQTDLYQQVGLTLARALCVRQHQASESQTADFEAIDKSILQIEKRTESLGKVDTWTQTIRSNSDKILKEIEIARKSLAEEVELLRSKIKDLKNTVSDSEELPIGN